jgi:hypothetical protein
VNASQHPGSPAFGWDVAPQPFDPKIWDSSDYSSWDAGPLPGDLNDPLCSLSSLCSPCSNIPGTQDEPLGFASLASAARLMDEILTPIPIDIRDLG